MRQRFEGCHLHPVSAPSPPEPFSWGGVVRVWAWVFGSLPGRGRRVLSKSFSLSGASISTPVQWRLDLVKFLAFPWQRKHYTRWLFSLLPFSLVSFSSPHVFSLWVPDFPFSFPHFSWALLWSAFPWLFYWARLSVIISELWLFPSWPAGAAPPSHTSPTWQRKGAPEETCHGSQGPG